MSAQWDDYRCESCGAGWSAMRRGSEPARDPCPSCGGAAAHLSTASEPTLPDLEILEQQERDRRRSDAFRAFDKAQRAFCPFCGKTLTRENWSDEHVLAKWLRKVPPLSETLTRVRGGGWRWSEPYLANTTTGKLVLLPPRMYDKKHQHELFATVVVCAECNSGWMSNLETLAKPILTPLITGDATHVKAEDARVLARWAAKVHIAWERDDPASATTHPAQRRDVIAGRPARWASLWMGANLNPDDLMLRHERIGLWQQGSGELLGHVTRTTVGLGSIFLQLSLTDWPSPSLGQLEPTSPWVQIYPSAQETVAIEGGMTRADIDAAREATRGPMEDRELFPRSSDRKGTW